MKKSAKNHSWKPNKLTGILAGVTVVLVAVLVVMLVMLPAPEENPVETVPPTTAPAPTETPTEEPTEAPTETVPAETEPVMLANMAELYAQNPDIAGWVKVEGTKIDCPVMYTPEENDKYLHLSFQGKYSYGGELYIDKKCTIDPECMNIIIYGHNMNDGSKFNNLMKFGSENFWKEHPIIHYSTLYEERTYEIIAAFKDRVYRKSEDVFKFYNFTDPETEEAYNEGISYFKEKSIYDTGVTAEYGDRLLTLVTCAYHVQNGRFVVVAREVTEEPVETVPTETVPNA